MIAYCWSNDTANAADPERVDFSHSTVFRFTLDPVGDGTPLTVGESEWDRRLATIKRMRRSSREETPASARSA